MAELPKAERPGTVVTLSEHAGVGGKPVRLRCWWPPGHSEPIYEVTGWMRPEALLWLRAEIESQGREAIASEGREGPDA